MTPTAAGPERPQASEEARKLVANHELVAMSVEMLGATELGDAERMLLDFIARLESELVASRAALQSATEELRLLRVGVSDESAHLRQLRPRSTAIIDAAARLEFLVGACAKSASGAVSPAAPETLLNHCAAVNREYWVCSLPKGHDGDHRAHCTEDNSDEPRAVWAVESGDTK